MLAHPIALAVYSVLTSGGYHRVDFAGYSSRQAYPLIKILGKIGSPSALWILRGVYSMLVKKYGYRSGVKRKGGSNVFDPIWLATCIALNKCDKPRRWWEKLLNRRPWAR